MSDPTYPPEAFLFAHDLVRSIGENLSIHFQMEGLQWERDKMQRHINDRAAIIRVQQLILDAGEKAIA